MIKYCFEVIKSKVKHLSIRLTVIMKSLGLNSGNLFYMLTVIRSTKAMRCLDYLECLQLFFQEVVINYTSDRFPLQSSKEHGSFDARNISDFYLQ